VGVESRVSPKKKLGGVDSHLSPTVCKGENKRAAWPAHARGFSGTGLKMDSGGLTPRIEDWVAVGAEGGKKAQRGKIIGHVVPFLEMGGRSIG